MDNKFEGKIWMGSDVLILHCKLYFSKVFEY